MNKKIYIITALVILLFPLSLHANEIKEENTNFKSEVLEVCQSLRILNHYLANYLGRFLIKFKVNFLGDCIFRLV